MSSKTARVGFQRVSEPKATDQKQTQHRERNPTTHRQRVVSIGSLNGLFVFRFRNQQRKFGGLELERYSMQERREPDDSGFAQLPQGRFTRAKP